MQLGKYVNRKVIYKDHTWGTLFQVANQNIQPGDVVAFAKSGRGEDAVELGLVKSVNGDTVAFTNLITGKTMSRSIFKVMHLPHLATLPLLEDLMLSNPEYFL